MELSSIFIGIGIVIIIAGAYIAKIIRYVPAPENWVIEINIPRIPTIKKVWKPGLNFLWIPIYPIMFIRNRLNCADEAINITIGADDQNPGGKSLVEFTDVSAGVHAQLILRVIDPIKATYEIDSYKKAAVDRAEANFRKLLGGMTLDEAMQNADKRSDITKKTFSDVNKAIMPWGVALKNPGDEITIIDFILEEKTIEQRDKIIAARKDYDVRVISAEATKRESILIREGEGLGEGEKIKILSEYIKMEPHQAMDYLLKLGMLKAIDGSTIIATSEGGNLNAPLNLAATMFAINSASKKSGGGAS